MQQAADLLLGFEDFESFSKTNTQVKTFLCDISRAHWKKRKEYSALKSLPTVSCVIWSGPLSEPWWKWPGKDQPQRFCRHHRKQRPQPGGLFSPCRGLFLKEILYPKDYRAI
jgi:tRNA pseudouridine38-40 synthase